jgi:hypothetical protein
MLDVGRKFSVFSLPFGKGKPYVLSRYFRPRGRKNEKGKKKNKKARLTYSTLATNFLFSFFCLRFLVPFPSPCGVMRFRERQKDEGRRQKAEKLISRHPTSVKGFDSEAPYLVTYRLTIHPSSFCLLISRCFHPLAG